jgi:hypothetical protein
LLPFEQRIEGVKELFLRAVLVCEELDVVDQERVERPVRRLELVHFVVLERDHHVADEALRMDVGNARLRIARLDRMSHGLHEVSLAETDTAVDEQGVISPPRVFRDLDRGGLRELVALSFDEAIEGEVGVEANTDDDAFTALRPDRPVGRLRRDRLRFNQLRADLDRHDGRVAFDEATHDLAQT